MVKPLNARDIITDLKGLSYSISNNELIINGKKKDHIKYIFTYNDIPYESIYKINYVSMVASKEYSDTVIISEERLNDSFDFVLPMLSNNGKYKVENFTDSNWNFDCLVDCNLSQDTTSLVLSYRYLPYTFYSNLIVTLKNNPYFMHIYKSEDNRFDNLVFSIPGEFKSDLNKIMKGKYSKTSATYRKTVMGFSNVPTKDIMGILTKSEHLMLALSDELDVPIQHFKDKDCELYKKPVLWKNT